MALMTPPFRSTGLWELRSPWSCNAVQIYTCIAIRKFDELVLNHEDVYTDYYLPKGLSYSAYQTDLEQGASLITILSEYGEEIDVPDTYIKKYPDINVADYKHIVLSASLGALPASADLSFAMTKVAEVLESVTGKKPTVLLHTAPTTSAVTTAQALQAETVRQNAITNRSTTNVTLSTLETKLSDMTSSYNTLKTYCAKLESQLSSNTKTASDELKTIQTKLSKAEKDLAAEKTARQKEVEEVRTTLTKKYTTETEDLKAQIKKLNAELEEKAKLLAVQVVPEDYRDVDKVREKILAQSEK